MTDLDFDGPTPTVIDQTYEMVDVDTLALHPNNPNVGDVGAIAESMKFHGFYGTVMVQKSTRRILAGNHRVLAARQVGIAQIPVLWVDVDDERAARLLLVDNRATRLGHDDDKILTELLQSLAMTDDVLAGTGFDGDDLDKLIAEAATPLNLDDEMKGWVVKVDVADEAKASELVAQLASAGYEAKAEAK